MVEEGKQPDANTLIQAFAPLRRRAMGMGAGVALGTPLFRATLASVTRGAQASSMLSSLGSSLVQYWVSCITKSRGSEWRQTI
jgi:hypothetical protein